MLSGTVPYGARTFLPEKPRSDHPTFCYSILSPAGANYQCVDLQTQKEVMYNFRKRAPPQSPWTARPQKSHAEKSNQ